MWYSDYYSGNHWCIGYAESTDGIEWDKYEDNPVFDVGSIATWEGFGVMLPMILFDGTNYKMWYTGYNTIGGTKYGIGYATSKAGTSVSVFSEEKGKNPDKYRLFQNYPNPFNTSCTIEWRLPETAIISLDIYDINGRFIENLYEGNTGPGYYRISWDARNYSSGFYFLKFNTNKFNKTIKLTLIK